MHIFVQNKQACEHQFKGNNLESIKSMGMHTDLLCPPPFFMKVMELCSHTHMHTHTRTLTHTHTHARMHAHAHTHTQTHIHPARVLSSAVKHHLGFSTLVSNTAHFSVLVFETTRICQSWCQAPLRFFSPGVRHH